MAISRQARRLLHRRRRALSSSSSPRPFHVIECLRRQAHGGPSRRNQIKEEEQVPPEAATSKILYMVTQYSFSPPITQVLFAVDLSSSSYGTCQLQEVKKNPEIISPSLYPVVEFHKGDFPLNMCFSMLGSKLYFFGGFRNHNDLLTVLSNKVYCIDTSKHSLIPTTSDDDGYGNSKTKPFDAKSLVHEAPGMLSGKRSCYGFVAYGKLYAIGTDTDTSPNKYILFEVYDPVRPNIGWMSLPDIPDREAVVYANAVVGRKVVFVTSSGMFSFNLETLKWKYFYYGGPPQCPGAYGEAVVLGNNIYWDRDYGGVTLVGPILVDLENKFHLIQGRSASGEFSDHLEVLLPENFSSSGLHYMGSNVFCYVMLGNPSNPDFAHVDDIGYIGDPEFCLCSIIVFQAPKETKNPPNLLPPGESHKQMPLEVKVMYAKRFFCRSKNGADHSNIFMTGCFSAPLPS